jgi:hypothetical protein
MARQDKIRKGKERKGHARLNKTRQGQGKSR